MSTSKNERALINRIAAHRSWANTTDPSARTAPARDAFRSRFESQVDPDGLLPEPERLRRAESARKAYYADLALKSAQARRRKREAIEALAAKTKEEKAREIADLRAKIRELQAGDE